MPRPSRSADRPRRRAPRRTLTILLAAGAALAATAPAVAAHGPREGGDARHGHGHGHGWPGRDADARFATFNASLNRAAPGQLVADLSDPAADTIGVRQARNVAEVIQRAAPDVVLVNEFDYVEGGVAARLFRDNFLAVSQNGAPAADYPYFYVAPSNTGVPSGLDLDNSGDADPADAGNDALGFGLFPGQYGMVVYSKFPIDERRVRTFQHFRWKDMPGARLPDDPATPAPRDFYSGEELEVLPLSSKSHWDVPIRIGWRTVHFLVSHPTPPTFDGAEDRNGTRNADEIRFWADYVTPLRGRYVYDDRGRRGGLSPWEPFVIAGDQNADPRDGDSVRDAAGDPVAIAQLLDNPWINADDPPRSDGAVEAAALQGGANATHRGDPAFDTADFSDAAPGNLRADYVLPKRTIRIVDAGVFWPPQADPLARLTGVFDSAQWGPVGGFPTSDHRLVWTDLDLPLVR